MGVAMSDRAWTEETRQRVREKFLRELAKRGIVADACKIAKVGRATVYKWREDDKEFADAWKEAVDIAIDTAEREAWRRAVEGVDKPLIGRVGKDQDGVITVIKEYSDSILLRVLSANRPEKWRERSQIEHTGEITQKVYAGFDPDNV